MTSFDLQEPSLPFTSPTVGMQDVGGLIKVHFRMHLGRSRNQLQAFPYRLVQRFIHQRLKCLSAIAFTEIDRAFLVWGAITIIIFSLAQFSSLSWATQAFIDAALTGLGITSTSKLTWRLACNERLRWVVCLWAVLMAGGMIATAYGIFCGVGAILVNLCVLWLSVCALGYLAMAIGLGSRSFSAASAVHALGIPFLVWHPAHQFFTSGLVIALTLFFFSFVPWDMRESEAEELCGVKPKA
ncbi:MAG: hypothetical protein AB8B99_15775 [Phormidesmis sp.]